MNAARPITDRITIADQPSEADLASLKAEGYVGVVNLREDGEPEQPMDVTTEGEKVRDLGMNYEHYGVGGAPLSDPGVIEACNFIDKQSQEGKVLVHCKAGARAAAIVLIQQARYNAWDTDEVFEKGAAMGLNLPPGLRNKVDAYLRSKE